MADVTKTVAIVFTGDSSDAQKKVDDLAKGLEGVNKEATKESGLASAAANAENFTRAAAQAATGADGLAQGLSKVAKEAGVSNEGIVGIERVLLRLGGSGNGFALAAAAIAATGAVMVGAGNQALEFKTKFENLTGSSTAAQSAFDTIQNVVRITKQDLVATGDAYTRYLTQLEGTSIPAKVAEDAFIGIIRAIKGQGGDVKDAEKILAGFVKAAADGKVDLKELEDVVKDIPGGMRLFAESLGVPIEDLKLLAENGQLGQEEIARFAETLRTEDYGSLTPVKDAFTDLMNVIKEMAIAAGAEGIAVLAFETLAGTIRAVTATLEAAVAIAKVFRDSFFNVIYSALALDGGFLKRQEQAWAEYSNTVVTALKKVVGADAKVPKPEAPTKDYNALADSIREVGDANEEGSKKQTRANTALSDATKLAIAEQRAQVEREKLLVKEEENQRKQVENDRKFTIEREKIRLKEIEIFNRAQEAVGKFRIELEKIASNERIKTIEANVKLNVAQIEADTKRVQAAFESINKGIESTGKLTEEILKGFKDIPSEFDPRFKIFREQLTKETGFREQQFKLQKELTEVQIASMRAQLKAMENGNPLIKIDGAGLQPHLEAFMWEILRAIQVRVNQQGLKMLLGV